MNNVTNKKLDAFTLEEKAVFVNGATFFGAPALPQHGIARLQLLDGGTGMNFEQLFGDFYSAAAESESTNGMIGSTLLQHVIDYYYEPERLNEAEYEVYQWIREKLDARTGMPTLAPGCFPPGMALGATFHPETVLETGRALGLEAAAYGVDILLGTPNVNIHRDPLNGRLFEGYSEDPCLVATLAPELVKGVQEYPVAANVKHFAANNQETNRVGINETISKRALEEIYFPGFKACVQEGGVKTVMSAYNKINGIACTENYWLLTETLREEWGFSGPVISDWGAVYHPDKAIAAGNDLAMPGPLPAQPIIDAVQAGTLSEAALDAACENLLALHEALAEEKRAYKPTMTAKEIMAKTDEAARNASLQGIVLLKNTGIFPLHNTGTIWLTGSGREHQLTCGTGSAGITTNRNTDVYTELAKIYGDRVQLCGDIAQTDIADADVVLCIASLSGMEGNDRPDMRLSAYDRGVLTAMNELKQSRPAVGTGLLLNVCGPVELYEYEPYLDGIFCMFLSGMMGGNAMAQLLSGAANPSGKLPLTFPKRCCDTPAFLNFPGEGNEVNYGEGIYVGYRYYDKKQIAPMYHFGYGLSYTTFAFSDIQTDCERFDSTITVTGKIRNTGDISGAQVVQLYISDVVSSMPKPVKELKRFAKIFLQAGEEKAFRFTLTEQDFASFDPDYDRFLCEEGYFDIHIATSAAPADCVQSVRVYKTGTSPYTYGLNSKVKVLYENESLKTALFAWFTAQELDLGIIESNYQYTPSRRLSEILPARVDTNPETNAHLQEFLRRIGEVEKP
ncbi:MAG: hypothetical protein E7502_02835 [Ruminococcus sp.]|nr:hypothetical protein [Ruminococcus sp.]